MQYRTLTVSREFGSGGGRIANTVAGWLGWKLLDAEIINAIARTAHVESHVVEHYDERVGSWLHRINEEALRGVAMATGRPIGEGEIFDAQLMGKLTRKIIEEAHTVGNCVIVGRGAQCVLDHRSDVFHAYIYAPFRERVHRLRARLGPGVNIENRIREMDEERARYLRQNFGKNWCSPHLYDLMIRSHEDEDATARVILYAMTGKV